MASISRNQEEDQLYEVLNAPRQLLPGGGAHVTPSQGNLDTTLPPPLPPRASIIDEYAVEGNPSYLTQRQSINPPPSLSSPPPYDAHYVSVINDKMQPDVTKSLPTGSLEGSTAVTSPGPDRPLSLIEWGKGPKPDIAITIPPSIKEDPKQSKQMDAVRPSGYNIMNLFWRGNVIFLVPANSMKLLPLIVSGKTVRGGGSYNDDSKFEVVVPRGHSTESVVALRNVKHKERFLCINRNGKIIARNGYKDSCDFFVSVKNGETSPTVYFESARSDGFYLGVKNNNSVVDAANDITAESEEAQFTVIADRIEKSVPASKLKAFETDSIMNRIHDRNVIRLFSDRRYLAVDLKGRVMQTHNPDNQDCWFMVFDRGMGVVSLRSYNYAGYWLKILESQVLGKGMLGPEALFVVKETQDHLLCFESLIQPGIFVSPPLKSRSVSQQQFTVEVLL